MQEFDPVPVLESAGINNFHIDYDRKRVKLSASDLEKLKKAIGNKIYYYRGWIFREEVL